MSDNACPKQHISVASIRCKQLYAKNKQNHSTLLRDISNLSFQRTLGMLDHTYLKQHDNAVASIGV